MIRCSRRHRPPPRELPGYNGRGRQRHQVIECVVRFAMLVHCVGRLFLLLRRRLCNYYYYY